MEYELSPMYSYEVHKMMMSWPGRINSRTEDRWIIQYGRESERASGLHEECRRLRYSKLARDR